MSLPSAINACARAKTSKADSVPKRDREAAVFNMVVILRNLVAHWGAKTCAEVYLLSGARVSQGRQVRGYYTVDLRQAGAHSPL